jgi:rubrerythrin
LAHGEHKESNMQRVTTFNRFLHIGAFLALLGGLASPALGQETKPAKPDQKPEPTKATTLNNLMKAYDGESNAYSRYVAFAKKADEEGYGQVASLFRAVARAEQIHVNNHAAVIQKMGGKAKVQLEMPAVKSTKENLEAALKGESYERDTMYPEFIRLAKEAGEKDAVRTLNFALQAETEHAKLLQEALANLDQWKDGKKDFFVCPVCGNTVATITFEKCPVCATPKAKYEKIN